MISLYLLWVLISGYALASVMTGASRSTTLKLALTPGMGIFFPSLILYIFNMLKVPLTSGFLWSVWGILGILIIIWRKNDLLSLIFQTRSFYKDIPKWGKVGFILLGLSLFALLFRVALHPIWPGDGMSFWGKRALEWVNQEKLIFSPQMEEAFRTWNNYPLYHSLGMMVNILAIPSFPPSISVNLFDGFYMLGIFFTSLSFLRVLQWSPCKNLLGAILLAFGQRGLLETLVSGYAEIDMAYFNFLGMNFIVHILAENSQEYNADKKPMTFNLFFILGLVLGLLSITKNEGPYRMVILLGVSLVFFYRPWKGNKKGSVLAVFLLFLPVLLMITFDKVNRPVVSDYSQYTSEMIFSLQRIGQRIPLALQGLYFSFVMPTQHFHKCSWPLSLILGLLGYTYLLSADENHRIRKVSLFLGTLFLGNLFFNILPTLLVDNKVDPRLDFPRELSSLVLMRLNLQGALFLNALVILGLGAFWERFSLRIPVLIKFSKFFNPLLQEGRALDQGTDGARLARENESGRK